MAAPTWLVVFLPFILLVGPPIWGFTLAGCVPIHNDGKGHVVCVGSTNKVETISEMVARSGNTAEAFSAAAAISLVGMYIALQDIFKDHRIHGAAKDAALAAYYVGAVGFIGLTVWSIRVSGGIHTGFTVQTLSMMALTCVVLCVALRDDVASFFCALLILSMLMYGGLYAAKTEFSYLGNNIDYSTYHDMEYNKHAPAQFAFVALYYLTIGRLHHVVTAPAKLGASGMGAYNQLVQQGTSQLHRRAAH